MRSISTFMASMLVSAHMAVGAICGYVDYDDRESVKAVRAAFKEANIPASMFASRGVLMIHVQQDLVRAKKLIEDLAKKDVAITSSLTTLDGKDMDENRLIWRFDAPVGTIDPDAEKLVETVTKAFEDAKIPVATSRSHHWTLLVDGGNKEKAKALLEDLSKKTKGIRLGNNSDLNKCGSLEKGADTARAAIRKALKGAFIPVLFIGDNVFVPRMDLENAEKLLQDLAKETEGFKVAK